MYNFTDRLTDRARKVMALANQEAQRFNHEYIGTEHLLLGIVKEGSGVGANVLKNIHVDLRQIRLEVEKLVKSGPDMVTMGKLPQTPRATRVLEYAVEEARNLNHNWVGTEHILLGLIRERDGVAAMVLMNLGCTLEELRETTLDLLGAGEEPLKMEQGPDEATLKAKFEEAVRNCEYEEAAKLRDQMLGLHPVRPAKCCGGACKKSLSDRLFEAEKSLRPVLHEFVDRGELANAQMVLEISARLRDLSDAYRAPASDCT